MARRNKFFYGNDGTDVDIAQRHAPSNFYGDDGINNVVRAALNARPKATNDDDVKEKRLEDSIRESQAGVDTTPDDEALMRQENIDSNRTNAPIPDEHTEKAESITRYLQKQPENKYSMTYRDPAKRAEFVSGLAAKLRGGPATPATQPEVPEKPFSNDFLNDPAEVAKYGRPRKF